MAPLTTRPANFDRLARVYGMLERVAFGRGLERTRFCFLERLVDCENILVLGEGDGRCLERIAALAPSARIHCVDASRSMLARAASRLPAETQTRVTFQHADVLTTSFQPAHYDAVVTLFFLDCFTTEQVDAIVRLVHPALRSGASWLFADFSVPASGLSRWRARAWLALLYAFFRWQTQLTARSLPPSEELLRARGFRCAAERSFDHGLLRSAVYVASLSGGAI
jgi:ubiquinone/menaquinone biosynthesis C-methylase UbiE